MSAAEGTLLLMARSFTAHCSVCGRAWSIPSEIPDFETQQRQVIDWFHEHLSTVCALGADTPPQGSDE